MPYDNIVRGEGEDCGPIDQSPQQLLAVSLGDGA